MSDPSEVLAGGLHERIAEISDYDEEYCSVMGYELTVQVVPLGVPEDQTNEVSFNLGNCDVNILHHGDTASGREDGEEFARVMRLEGDWGTLHIEADHHGPEHGVDVWFGHDGKPEKLVRDIEVSTDV